MGCFYPLHAFRLVSQRTENGKSKIVFSRKELTNHAFEPIEIACGQCRGCRIDKAKGWALRCVHEAELHDDNCFITLTYRDENLPEHGSLKKKDFQLFMKRLRKFFRGVRIRFYMCGEYGEQLKRPHFHACLFGLDFPDKILWDKREGVSLYRSAILEKLWPYGYSIIGEVTYDSAAYVARYIMKKINGRDKEEHYKRVNIKTGEVIQIQQEFTTMSRRPGIGKEWLQKYHKDVYPKDFTTYKGKKFRPPRYYDNIYDEMSPGTMKKIKRKRVESINPDEHTPKRLKAREKYTKLRLANKPRKVEQC